MPEFTLRPYQQEAFEKVLAEWNENKRLRTLLVLPTGCHARGERILLADGTIKNVENVKVGDKLLGSDGKVRNVHFLHSGFDDLYKIQPIKGDSFIVTSDHQLTLVRTNESKTPKYPCKNNGGSIIDVTVKEWLSWSNYKKHLYKLIRSDAIESFPLAKTEKFEIAPYFLGVLLGDGGLKHSVSITTMDKEIVDVIKKEARKRNLYLTSTPAGKATTYFFKSQKKHGQFPRVRTS